MNCLIGLSLTLVAIVAGMLLLAQTQKENLGNIYKAVSYFVIITSFLAFLAGVGCGICQLAHCGKGGCGSMEKCRSMNESCMPGNSCCMGEGKGCGKTMKYGMGHGKGMGCGMMGMRKHKMMCGKGEMMSWEEEDEDQMEDVNVEIIHKKVEKEEKGEKKEEPVKK
jgi:hypothetical protein